VTEKNKCILVADSNAAVRRLVADTFEASEFYVIEATNGLEALGRLDTSAVCIDVLLAEMDLPRLNGSEFVRVIAARHPTIKLIFMSGHSADIDEHGWVAAGKTRYLKKPFTPAILEQAIRDALKREP
jgi:two-component system, cell cycle sensor histidine kinase and response regulator CckA